MAASTITSDEIDYLTGPKNMFKDRLGELTGLLTGLDLNHSLFKHVFTSNYLTKFSTERIAPTNNLLYVNDAGELVVSGTSLESVTGKQLQIDGVQRQIDNINKSLPNETRGIKALIASFYDTEGEEEDTKPNKHDFESINGNSIR